MTSVLPRNSSHKELNRETHSRKRRHPAPCEADSPVADKSPRDEDTRGQKDNTKEAEKKEVDICALYGKTGGAYIPPARLKQMQAQITDKSSQAYQRISWEALKKSIHGFINKVNVSNISNVVRQLLCENVVRGRGLLVRSLITAQTASPTFTHVFAALVAVINSKFPQVGELTLKRLINEFRKAFRRNQKDRCLSTARFLAHLVNQKVVHELIILELLTLLLEQTTDDSVEVAVAVLKECGAMLTKLVPKGIHGIFEHLRRILNEGNCDKRICYMLEVMFQIRRDGWKDHPIVLPELDLIPEDDQITHTTSLLDQVDPEDKLNVFRFDPNYLENEDKYAKIKASFFESDDEDSDAASDEDDDDDEEGADGAADGTEMGQAAAMVTATGGDGKQETIIDRTETNLVHLRRTIYLMLQSSVSADEGGHRLLQLKIRPGEEYEVASMVLDCCAQTRSYETRYGRLAQRLCHVLIRGPPPPTNGGSFRPANDLGPGRRYAKSDPLAGRNTKAEESTAVVEDTGPPRSYVGEFERIFGEQYAIIHRLETAKLRNVALFYAHLLYTDSISWGVLQCIRLNERDTTSSGRIFLKHLLLELCSFMGLAKLQARLKDETLQPFFAGLLPRDSPKDTRFAINFLTTIGLGALTLDLREHLQSSREAALVKRQTEAEESELTDLVVPASSSDSSSSETEEEEIEEEEEQVKEVKKRSKRKTSKKEKKKSKGKKQHKSKAHKSPSKTTGSDVKDSSRRNRSDTVPKKHLDSRAKHPRPIDTPFFNDTPNSPARVLPVSTVSSSKRGRHLNWSSPGSPQAPPLRSAVVRVTQHAPQSDGPKGAAEKETFSTEPDVPVQEVCREDSPSRSPLQPTAPAASPLTSRYKSSTRRDRSPHGDAADSSRNSDRHRHEAKKRRTDREKADVDRRRRHRSPHSVSSRDHRSGSRDRHRARNSPDSRRL